MAATPKPLRKHVKKLEKSYRQEIKKNPEKRKSWPDKKEAHKIAKTVTKQGLSMPLKSGPKARAKFARKYPGEAYEE